MTNEDFEAHRPKLFGIAYRMLGTVAEAEDAVQETYLRWHQRKHPEETKNVEAFLVTVTTRLCIDQLKSARVQREEYVGPWLPEPLINSTEPPPESRHELAETLSYAFLMLLERLNPAERAVYILREAFDFKHNEIAQILDRTPAASRKLNSRAKEQLKSPKRRFAANPDEQEVLLMKFVAAAAGSDMEPLFELLAQDVSVYSDGGGKVRAALKVLRGKERVVAFLQRSIAQQDPDSSVSFCRVNGQPAIQQSLRGKTIGVITLDVVDGKVRQVFIVRNPDKLALGEFGGQVA